MTKKAQMNKNCLFNIEPSRAILEVNPNGEPIGYYKSLRECEKATGVPRETIRRACCKSCSRHPGVTRSGHIYYWLADWQEEQMQIKKK